MGLMEQLEQDKAKLEEIDKESQEEEAEEEVEEDSTEEDSEEEAQEETEEDPEEEPKEEVKEEEEVRHNDFYKTRRENAALKKKIAELESGTPEAPQEDGVDHELDEVRQEVRVRKAEREFAGMEQEFAAQVSDYEDVSNQYKQSVYQAQRVLDPKASHADLLERTKMQILQKAGTYVNQGFDPIEELYNEAKSLGFKKKPQEAPKEEAEEPPTVDHNKLSANRQRNAGTAGAKGAANGGDITLKSAANMSVGDWAKLSKTEKRRLMYGE